MFSICPLKGFVKYFIFPLLLVAASCSKDDDANEKLFKIESFYDGSIKSASSDDLSGVWAIFSAQFEGNSVDVPATYDSCGRDFFVYSDDGTYQEYLYQSSRCEPQINKLNWELDQGVISLSNATGQQDDLVITKINDQELVFKSRLDVDEDGELDILILYAKKYEPNEPDFISNSFKINRDEDFENLISFTWQAYEGFNQFDRYELYRSVGDNCSKDNAQLIASIEDASITEFTDLAVPAADRLCYFLRVYTDKGLLAESNRIDRVPANNIRIEPVSLLQPLVVDEEIYLEWNKSDSPYFSHYEVVVTNDATTSAPQEYTLATIEDKDVSTFVDLEPPYFKDPIYRVYVHNIFGNRSPAYSEDVTVFWEVPFSRKEILALNTIRSLTIDPEEPVIYFFGRNKEEEEHNNIHRFNYSTHQIESFSDIYPSSYTEVPIKVINSPIGKEVVIKQGIELHFYDALTMEFKYAIDPDEVFGISDFSYFPELDVWIITDSDKVYTLKREYTKLRFLSSQAHFSKHQGGGRYEPIVLKENRLLVGHRNENNSMVYTLDSNGTFLDSKTVPIHLKNVNDDKMLLNVQGDFLLDVSENRLYSTQTFQHIKSFEMPVFPSGTSSNGQEIYGTNNDPNWQVTNDSPHKREAVIFNRNTGERRRVETIGYPHLIFQDYKGDIISISTGLKKNRLIENYSTKPSMFIEIIPNF